MVVLKQRLVLPGVLPRRLFQTGGSGMANKQEGSEYRNGGRMKRTGGMAIVLEDPFAFCDGL
jgi:hypothetical protein